MRLDVMRRTMQALADMDLSAAEKIMEIAEIMAESHPRPSRDGDIDDAKLPTSQEGAGRTFLTSIAGDVSEIEKAPIAGALLVAVKPPKSLGIHLN